MRETWCRSMVGGRSYCNDWNFSKEILTSSRRHDLPNVKSTFSLFDTLDFARRAL
jgi:hypothetical protein